MDRQEGFSFNSQQELVEACNSLGVELRLAGDPAPLQEKLSIEGRVVPNRLAVQPMEGFDGTPAGEPGELTRRRYHRFAGGGAGMIWFEATAVMGEGASNARQLVLNEETLPALAELLAQVNERREEVYGDRPYSVLQLTHSGRFSRPDGSPQPRIAVHHPEFDRLVGIDKDYPVVTDDELKEIREAFVTAAALAHRAGFDAVDIKACHRYLFSELLGAKARPGPYGGDYEGRTRLLKETVRRVREEVPGISVAVRLNVYDGIDPHWGWGVAEDGERLTPDLQEPLRLVAALADLGVVLLNVTAGTPYYNPHVNRPYERPSEGGYRQPEPALAGVARLLNLGAAVQEAVPGVPVVGTGYTWLRQFGARAACGYVGAHRHSLAGFGRQAFAYPDFARDLLSEGELRADRCCVTCSRCTDLMRSGRPTGCPVRDREVYGKLLREAREEQAAEGGHTDG